MSNEKNDNEKVDQVVPGHDYDGIQEFNNAAPFWWQLFFYISIVWGIGYFVYYQMLGGPTLDQELAARMAVINKTIAAAPQEPAPEQLAAVASSDTALDGGKKVYIEKCQACHADGGAGMVGPNLTDEYWLLGDGSLKSIVSSVKIGVPEKGMPAWGPLLTNDELLHVAAFVKSLAGTLPKNPKGPQGNKVAKN